jgi:hypothetical protein
MPKTIIVVHGVGRAAPASVGGVVARTLGLNFSRQCTVQADGHALVEIRDETTGNRVLEVNWSDILRPSAAPMGIARHLWYILSSMVDVATVPGPGQSSYLARFYRVFLLTVTPGLVALTFATSGAVSLSLWWQRSLLVGLVIVGLACLAEWLRRQGSHFWWLWLWVLPLLVVLSCTIAGPVRASDWINTTSNHLRTVSFVLVVALLALATFEGWIRLRDKGNDVQLAYAALLYLPFLAVNSVMAWFGFLGLSLIKGLSDGDRYADWEKSALADFRAQMYPQMEGAATFVISAIGILAILLPYIGYRLAKRGTGELNVKGMGAQNGLRLFLVFTPILLLLLGLFCVWLYFRCSRGSCPQPFTVPENILEIYRLSVLRTFPLLGWLVSPLAVVLDVIGDVVFYLQPNDKHPAAIGEACRKRLRAALRYAEAAPETTTVLGHSQGSVIAADLRARQELGVPLVTIGCPLGSLYGRFLAAPPVPAATGLDPWCNAYRDGDVIAGPVKGADKNVNLGPGGHTNYWADERLARVIVV